MSEHHFRPHRTQRKGVNVVYIKASDQIENLLAFMGAGGAAMRVMEQRMYNDMRNRTNRLSNCETANLGKSVQAAVQVQLAIRTLRDAGALDTLPDQLRETARLRMEYPDLPLARLAEKFDPPVSKAGLSPPVQAHPGGRPPRRDRPPPRARTQPPSREGSAMSETKRQFTHLHVPYRVQPSRRCLPHRPDV